MVTAACIPPSDLVGYTPRVTVSSPVSVKSCVRFVYCHPARALGVALGVSIVVVFAGLTVIRSANGLWFVSETYKARLTDTMEPSPYHEDYLAYYAAGRLVIERRTGDLYQWERVFEEEKEAGGFGGLTYFNPPFVALLMAPLSLLPADRFLILWALGVLIVVVGTAALGPYLLGLRGWRAVAAGLSLIMAETTVWTLVQAQITVVVVLGWLGFLAFHQRCAPRASGLSLCLLLVKPQMAILPVAVLLWRREWKTLRPFAVGTLALVALSVAVSPSALWMYPALLVESMGWYQENGVDVPALIGWNGWLARLGGEEWARWALPLSLTTVASVAWASRGRRESPEIWAVMAVTSLLIGPHVYGHDVTIVFPPLFLALVGGDRWLWMAAAIFSVLVVWHPEFPPEVSTPLTPALVLLLVSLLIQRQPGERDGTFAAAGPFGRQLGSV